MIDVENIPLDFFETFKRKNNVKRYQEDCNDYELREKIRDDLILKQREQCAYCERKITKSTSHIEHIYPRDKNHKLECEYSNLVLSCESDDSCGKYKDATDFEKRFIHPVLDNPEKYFRFSSNGEILSINKNQNVEDSIEFLNLNSAKLIRLRKKIFFALNSMREIEDISEYFFEFENLIKGFEK